MLKAQSLKDVLEVLPGEPPRVEAVILCEDFSCGLRLKHAFDELFSEVFSRAGWAAHYRLSLWSFGMLKAPSVRKMAAAESAHAALFAVAVDGGQWLDLEVTSLVEQWLASRDGRASALLMAGYGDEPMALKSSPAGSILDMAAKRTGKLFLVHPLGQTPVRPLDLVREGWPEDASI